MRRLIVPIVLLHVCYSWVPSTESTVHRDTTNSVHLPVHDATSSPVETARENDSENPCIPIIFETDRFLIISKPPGIPYHNDADRLGIVSLLRQQLQKSRDDPPRIYGCHRLDRVTTGILVFGKDSETAAFVQRSFFNGKVVKYYVGLSDCKPSKKKQGWVQGNMVRGRRKSWYLERHKADTDDSTKLNYAKTRFFTAGLGQLETKATATRRKTLVLFRPYTGKTHQLRVAAKSVGLGLVGDPVYGSNKDSSKDTASRTYLHATALHIPGDENGLDGLTLWYPPDDKEFRGTSDVIKRLMHKHCDCPELLDAMDIKEHT